MEPANILIVEDEFIISEDLTDTLIELGYHVTESVSSYDEALTSLEKKTPDIVLIDINLNDQKDGIDLGTLIRNSFRLPFIFITSHSDKTTVERAKKVKPNGYLLKPFNAKSLFTAIETALSNYCEYDDGESLIIKDAIFVKDGHLYKKLSYNDIIYVNSEGNYIEIQTKNGRFVIRQTLKEFEKYLPKDDFFKVHKSYIINIKKIDAINSVFVVVGDKEIPISRSARQELMSKIHTT